MSSVVVILYHLPEKGWKDTEALVDERKEGIVEDEGKKDSG